MTNKLIAFYRWMLLIVAIALALPLAAQQNQKLVFPNPAGFFESSAETLLNTPDGGWLIVGNTHSTQGERTLPRVIKLDPDATLEWDQFYLNPPPGDGARVDPINAINAPDGGWLISLQDDTTSLDLMKVAPDGSLSWTKDLGATGSRIQLVKISPNNTYYGWTSNGQSQQVLKELALNGDVLSTIVVPNTLASGYYILGASLTTNNEIQTIYYKYQNGQNLYQLIRYDLALNIVWQGPVFNFGVPRLIATPDNGFLLLQITNTISGLAIQKIQVYDALGAQLSSTDVSFAPELQNTVNIVPNDNGELTLSGSSASNRGVVIQLNPDFSIKWTAQSPSDNQPEITWLGAIPTTDGWAAGMGGALSDEMAFVRFYDESEIILKTIKGRTTRDLNENCVVETGETPLKGSGIKAQGQLESFYGFTDGNGEYTIYVPGGTYTLTCDPADQFFYTCPDFVADVVDLSSEDEAFVDFPIWAIVPIHEIKGTAYRDLNDNCQLESGELPLKSVYVRVTGNGYQLYDFTDNNGRYSMFVPDGTYTVTPLAQGMNQTVCGNSSHTVEFAGTVPQVATFDYLVKKAFDCGIMKTWVGGSEVRPCTTETFVVGYRNIGTNLSTDVLVNVQLDPKLEYVSATPAPASVNGQSLLFNIGSVPEGFVGSIHIAATPSCDLQIGEYVCISSQVSPDKLCYSSPNWSGAIVKVEGACDPINNESVFKIKNIGTAPNAIPLEYIVVEEQIVLKTGPFQLNPGDSLVVTVPASNQPQVCIADQEPGFPGDTSVTYILNGCIGSGGLPIGFNNPPGFFSSQACFDVVNSFDPNDKQARPEGFGPEHIIWPGTALDYRIRFQNTGNDTAFLVVIRDTLDVDLDPGTFELRGSSHPVRVDLLASRILQFTFEGIQLPDSLTNPEGSQGYVDFNMQHQKDLALGTLISNRAGIYFDNNAPIITNTVTRKVDKFLIVSVDDHYSLKDQVRIQPNPVAETARIELPESFQNSSWTFELRDVQGKSQQLSHQSGSVYQFERNGLPAGVYFWQIYQDGIQPITGKVVLK